MLACRPFSILGKMIQEDLCDDWLELLVVPYNGV